MKSKLLWLLLIPYALFSGMGYGFLAHYLVRDKEPWFTFLLFGGLATTITLITWLAGIPIAFAVWTFIGSGSFYLLLRLLFGKGSAFEMLAPAHIMAILALLSWGAFKKVQQNHEETIVWIAHPPESHTDITKPRFLLLEAPLGNQTSK